MDQYYGDKTHQNYADYYDGIDYDMKNDDFYDDLKKENHNDTLVIYFYRIYDQKTLFLWSEYMKRLKQFLWEISYWIYVGWLFELRWEEEKLQTKKEEPT